MTENLQTHFSKTKVSNLKTMNAIALVAFMLLFFVSTLAHADHLIELPTNVEQQECYICHQGLDTPPELVKISFANTACYSLVSSNVSSVKFSPSYFVQPQLRAPPVLQ